MATQQCEQQFARGNKHQKGYASKWNAMLARRIELGLVKVEVRVKKTRQYEPRQNSPI